MKDKDYFDNMMKSAIDDSIYNIEASRDIFNEAWNKKEREMNKRKYFNMKYIKRVALIPACCAALTIVGVFTFSPGARVAAQDVFKTIFLPDKAGNIVEKSEDTKVPVGVGPINVTNENKKDMERRVGFKINLPEKIGDYSYEKIDDYVFSPGVMIMAKDVKYKDSEAVSDKLKKSIDDDKAFEELEKDYNLSRIVSASYEDNQGHKFQLIPIKDNGKQKKHDDAVVVKEVKIDDITCTVTQDTKVNYNVKEDGVTDLEHKPTGTEERYYVGWSYDGINYGLAIGSNSSDIDASIEFAKEYIKILKEK